MTPQTLSGAARYGAFGTWLAGTVSYQDPFLRDDRIRRFDPFDLIFSDWRFFAPNPSIHDYHLLYRDRLITDRATRSADIDHVDYATEGPEFTAKAERNRPPVGFVQADPQRSHPRPAPARAHDAVRQRHARNRSEAADSYLASPVAKGGRGRRW